MAGELPFEKPLSELRKKIEELKKFGAESGIDFTDEIMPIRRKMHASAGEALR